MILELFLQVMIEDVVNFADQSKTDAESEDDIYSFYAEKRSCFKLLQCRAFKKTERCTDPLREND